jgi:ribonuclease HI
LKVQAETLQQLVTRLGIHTWDYLLVGDGSGSNWDWGAGWGSVLIEAATDERIVFGGGVNLGTVNFAEIMAALQPLEYVANKETAKRKASGKTRAVHVHILTDSEYCRNTGNSSNRMMDANAGLWAVFDVFKRHGLIIRWHWIKRETVDLNRYADTISKLVRVLLKGYNLQQKVAAAGDKRSVYAINPDD